MTECLFILFDYPANIDACNFNRSGARLPRGFAPFVSHRYIAAYARQGRQASAHWAISRALLKDIARINPRSLAGKASVSLSARIAMYCAVQSPMPGISSKRDL